MKDHPSELAAVTRRMADSGVNIEFFYTATRTRMVLGVSDTEKACKLLDVDYAPA
jgi:hypothetical protein